MINERNEPDKETIARSRQLRKQSTFPERLLWGRLRDRRLAGLKFRRQNPVGEFIVDFYCEEHHLAIELDGNSHNGHADCDRSR